jgi:CheY-like chemotaxis protein
MARILIMDDSSSVRAMLRKTLEDSGYEVVEAANGVEGIRLHREEPADVIIVDIIMPKKEGIETIMELKQEFPEVKIIAISGGGRLEAKEYLRIAKQVGATRAFAKPIEQDELLEAVQELLKESRG